MDRSALNYLKDWLTSTNRKPLVIRGARQVGKTWLVKHFTKISGKTLIELNFERYPTHSSFFNINDPKQILLNISAGIKQEIDPSNCVLLLDEIQAAPQLFSKLRWFAEDLPELPIIATGSLLEFVLADHTFSMPVGRINYMHLEPMSFEEFLLANDRKLLYEYLTKYELTTEIPIAIHDQLTQLFKEYIIIGGLPAAVLSWVTDRSLSKINQIQMDLLATYHDDFTKYKGRIAIERLDEVMNAVPKMLGQKFIYSRVNKLVPSNTTKQILELLKKARICNKVQGCYANGIPLGAEINEKSFKVVFIDTGLCSAELGINLNQINSVDNIFMINNGAIAEQVVGQILRTINPLYIEPTLYYWQRDELGSNAEIDYVIQNGSNVLPIEVKAGATGSLKSLHLFMDLKKYTIAIRINSDLPNIANLNIKNSNGNKVKYKLISLPFYLTGQILRLTKKNGVR